MPCVICGNGAYNSLHIAREMMFGLRDEFQYVECNSCGSLFMRDAPSDMGRFYPSGYYSMIISTKERLAMAVSAPVLKAYLFIKPLRALLEDLISLWGRVDLNKIAWLLDAPQPKNAKILDVGCGVGKLLMVMHYLGFTSLTGLDPFLEHDISYPSGICILKEELSQHEGSYDLIMLHHALEHMTDPLGALHHCLRLTAPGGRVVIRTPIMQTHAWRTYGIHWSQLDAPRHINLFSLKGMHLIANKAGFDIAIVRFDSNEFQFWGSEQYVHDIPYMDSRSYKHNPSDSIFTRKQIKAFREHARILNKKRDGDQACFVLEKK